MRGDSDALKAFYRPTAFVRDSELLDVAIRLIEGVEAFKSLTLPCNSSLLNTWQLPSLFLAGIWAPTLKVCPVAPCDDVAQMVEEKATDTNSDTCSLSSAMSVTSQSSSLRQMVALNEDEALKIILSRRNKGDGKNVEDNLNSIVTEETSVELSEDKNSGSDMNSNVGNSLGRKSGWSFDESHQKGNERDVLQDEAVLKNAVQNEPKSTEASFHALIESYNMLSGGYIKTPDLKEVWQKFENGNVEQGFSSTESNNVSIYTYPYYL